MAIKRKAKGSKKRKGGVISVDFTGVESGGRPVPDGSFKAEITSFEQEESSTGNDMIVCKFKILQGKGKGTTVYDNLSLQPQALFRLKSLCEALGIDADGAADLDPDDFVGQEVILDIENETYEGKKRPRPAGYASVDGETSEEDDEEESEDEDEESEDEDEDEDEDDDEEDEKPARKKKTVKKASKKSKDEDEDEEEEDEEEEDEEESDDGDDDEEDEEEDDEEERPTKRKPGRKDGKTSTGLVKGAKVSFKDGKKTIRGTVVSVKNKTARIEDKNGDEYDVPSEQVELL